MALSCCGLGATGEPGSCLICGARGTPVSRTALEQLLRPERRGELIDAPYYACATPECDVVYFADAPLHYFAPEDLTARPGLKEMSKPGPDDCNGDREE